MKRADRKNSNDDNSNKFLRSKQKEPIPPGELNQLLDTIRSQRDEWKQQAKENELAATELVQIQEQFTNIQSEVGQWKELAQQNNQIYLQEKERHEQTFILYQETQTKTEYYIDNYNQEKVKKTELLVKYEEAKLERERYLTLYQATETQLKFERRSKAGIKSWETRRKKQNEHLKQEIAEMTVLLQDSFAKKEEAVNNLYIVADRMDRIQELVYSVEEASGDNAVTLLQKLKRIWQAIREIISE